MTLEVLICTCGSDGLARAAAMTLPTVCGVSYLLSVQLPADAKLEIHAPLMRPDVRVVRNASAGLSNNRNAAFASARGDILLIADDDLHYLPEGLRAVLNHFEAHPECDFAAFRHTGGDGKWFPAQPFSFCDKPPRSYYLTSFELAVRRRSLHADLAFSPHFGIGAPYFQACEEEIFLLDMIRAGLRGSYVPVTIVEHPGVTTGVRTATPGVLRAQGACMRARHGAAMGLLHVLRDAPRRPASLPTALKYMLQGWHKMGQK